MKLGERRKTILRNLLINRIDLVDEGDNPEAKICIWKRAPDIEERKKLRKITDLEITEVSLVDAGANPGAKVLLQKRDHITPKQLWETFVSEFLANHNTKLREMKANPPQKMTQQEREDLEHKKPWTRHEAAAAARNTEVGENLWRMFVVEVAETAAASDVPLPAMKRGEKVFSEVPKITKAIQQGEIETQDDAIEQFDKFVKREVRKSGVAMDIEKARYSHMKGDAWDEFFFELKQLPVSKKEKELLEKQQYESNSVELEINRRALKFLKGGEAPTMEQAIDLACTRDPELYRKYHDLNLVVKGK